jgi:phosphatidylinositol alpha-1,6-mannosyltransferase
MRLLVSEIFPPQHGGSGRWLYEVYHRMPAGSVVVAVGEHGLAKEFDAHSGVTTERVPLHLDKWGAFGFRGIAQYWRLAARIRALVRKHKSNELHVARCLPEGFAAWLLRTIYGNPYVVYVHGEETRTCATSRELSWMTRRVYGGAKFLVANSQNTARILREEWGISQSRIRVLHPGVDAQKFVPAAPNEQIRRELGWNGRPVVLTVGRLQIRKGHDMLIRALPRIRQQIPNLLYAIVGDGEERKRLQGLVDELGLSENVMFHKEITDELLIACYQQCDIFALPNREVNGDFEGFGMVLVEAQACGKAVIAGISGGTRETMNIDETGLIGDCSTPDFLAEAVPKLLRDKTRLLAMGEAGRKWVVKHFDWTSLVEQAAEMLGIEMNGQMRHSQPELSRHAVSSEGGGKA